MREFGAHDTAVTRNPDRGRVLTAVLSAGSDELMHISIIHNDQIMRQAAMIGDPRPYPIGVLTHQKRLHRRDIGIGGGCWRVEPENRALGDTGLCARQGQKQRAGGVAAPLEVHFRASLTDLEHPPRIVDDCAAAILINGDELRLCGC